jgi:hypothetical protein
MAAVLIFAVLLLSAGVFVLAGVAQLAATQALVGQGEWDSLGRRVTLENSRVMARQYMLSRMYHEPISTINGASISSDLGGFAVTNGVNASVASYWSNAVLPSSSSDLRINPFSPMERGGFYPAAVGITLSNGTTEGARWSFLVRTRSPLAAGYSYVQQRPGERDFEGYVGYIDATNFVGYGNNIPDVPVSSVDNTNEGSGSGYDGKFDVPASAASLLPFPGTPTVQPIGDPVAPTGLEVVVDLSDDTYPVGSLPSSALAYRYVVPASTNYGPNTINVTRVTLVGTDNGTTLPPLLILATNNPALTSVELSGLNPRNSGRRVYLNLRNVPGPVRLKEFTGSSVEWRLGVSSKGSNVDINNVELIGGLRIDEDGPTLQVDGEDSPQGLDYIADQMMWLEDYRIP